MPISSSELERRRNADASGVNWGKAAAHHMHVLNLKLPPPIARYLCLDRFPFPHVAALAFKIKEKKIIPQPKESL